MADEVVHRLIIEDPEGGTRTVDVPVGITTLGRQTGNDLVLEHSQISRRHAQFISTKTECEIHDLGSSNGTSVNGKKIEPKAPVLLNPGDTIKIGGFILTYEAIEKQPAVEKRAVEEAEKKLPEPEAEPDSPKEPEEHVKEEEAAPVKKKTQRLPSRPPAGRAPPPPPDAFELEAMHAPPPFGLPGLSTKSSRLIHFLPGIYHEDFMERFLALFESILLPIEWNIDNFDLFLDSSTAPLSFLPWLARWYEIAFDPTWTEGQRRTLLKDAHWIYAKRGTKQALARLIEIYLGEPPEIEDQSEDLEAYTFRISIPARKRDINPELIEALVDASKPAYTSYTVKYKR